MKKLKLFPTHSNIQGYLVHLTSLITKNKKKIPSKKVIFWEMGFSCSNIRKAFLQFGKQFLIFQETELSFISGNRNPKKLLIFQEVTFPSGKIKRDYSWKVSYVSQKRNFLAPSLKNFLYFRKELTRLKNRQRHCSREFSCLL